MKGTTKLEVEKVQSSERERESVDAPMQTVSCQFSSMEMYTTCSVWILPGEENTGDAFIYANAGEKEMNGLNSGAVTDKIREIIKIS